MAGPLTAIGNLISYYEDILNNIPYDFSDEADDRYFYEGVVEKLIELQREVLHQTGNYADVLIDEIKERVANGYAGIYKTNNVNMFRESTIFHDMGVLLRKIEVLEAKVKLGNVYQNGEYLPVEDTDYTEANYAMAEQTIDEVVNTDMGELLPDLTGFVERSKVEKTEKKRVDEQYKQLYEQMDETSEVVEPFPIPLPPLPPQPAKPKEPFKPFESFKPKGGPDEKN